jgi:hypothetical protein
LYDRYEDVLWDKTTGGSKLKAHIDSLIMQGETPPHDVYHDVWMFEMIKEVGPT